MIEKCAQTAEDCASGKFKSMRKSAKANGISHSTLQRGLCRGDFPGAGGRTQTILFTAEEERVVKHVLHMADIGYGNRGAYFAIFSFISHRQNQVLLAFCGNFDFFGINR